MKAKVKQENFLKALQSTTRIISTKPQMPILQNVLIAAKETNLYLTATNLETTKTVWVGAKVEGDGGICVPARLITEFISSLGPEVLQLSVKDEVLHVTGERLNAKIPGISSSEFPPLPVAGKGKKSQISKETLSLALTTTLFAAASDQGRPVLTGVKIASNQGGMVFASTDGYRLSVKQVDVLMDKDVDMIVPASALDEVQKVLKEDKEISEAALQQTGDGQLLVQAGDMELFTRIIEGEFPDFTKIIPTNNATQVVIDRESLLRATKTAAIFARENANIIRFLVSKDGLTVSANAPSTGENEVFLDASVQGDEAEIAFNSRFIVDVLATITGERAVFEMTGALSPGVFKEEGDESFLHVIMPVRVQK